MESKKTEPPKALICGECFERQRSAAFRSEDEFYCEHHQVWAVRRADGGWLLSTEVTPADHEALVEDARRLQQSEDSGSRPALGNRVH